ncbi:MAG: metallophosphoesterase [Bacteroidaceae bacterium]|nr:metallophosphoesterase [Bacteroidaceae bacterium]
MRLQFMIFPVVVLLAVIYIYYRIWHILPFSHLLKWLITIVLLLPVGLFFGYMSSRNDHASLWVNQLFSIVSTSWMIILLYLLMIFLVTDIARLCIPAIRPWFNNSLYGTLGITTFMIVTFIGGNLWYHHKVRVPLSIEIDKPMKPIRIVGISDLHLGYTIGKGELAKWVEMINAEQPDLILIAGDIIDSDVVPVEKQRMYEELGQLKARYGVFTCLGNHDYYANNEKSEALIQQAGITLLKDEAMLVNDELYIVGRDDRANDYNRKSLADLTKDLDHSKPILLLDHQPYHLNNAVTAGVDFQLSGHTHRGQIFPISLITDMVYEKSHGYLRKGNTHIYVTSGIGLWGGKFRIGTQSEYLVLEMAGQ